MYIERRSLKQPEVMICPDCKGTRFRVNYSKAECINCGWKMSRGNNKYGAKKTKANDGIVRDSKYEATVADDLLFRKKVGDIKDYDTQYKVLIPIYDEDGKKVHEVSHKVDFRVHLNSGEFELLEAKGAETTDYRFRRKLLEKIWLPKHKDHLYTVIKQNRR